MSSRHWRVDHYWNATVDTEIGEARMSDRHLNVDTRYLLSRIYRTCAVPSVGATLFVLLLFNFTQRRRTSSQILLCDKVIALTALQ